MHPTNLKLSFAFLAIVVLLAACFAAAQDAQKQVSEDVAPEQVSERKLPALFDFSRYKELFHKNYRSIIEEVSRKALFIPRVLKVVASGMHYMHRNKNYYLSVNHMTDRTPEELSRLDNQLLGAKAKKSAKEAEETKKENEDVRVEMSDEELKQELDKLSEEVPDAAKMINMKESGRKKRKSSDNGDELPPRELDLSMLIEARPNAKLPEGTQVLDRVPSNNPNYVRLEAPSEGLAEQVKDSVDLYALGVNVPAIGKKLFLSLAKTRLQNTVNQDAIARGHSPKVLEGNDILYVDHSQGGCMDLPRGQGLCGSCWAFAGVALYEWLYCQKTGKLARFSEQYVNDCGQKYFTVDAQGCGRGGTWEGVPKFFRNFGAELRSNYPYRAVDQVCPYDDDYDNIKETGYIRFDDPTIFTAPYDLWEQYLFYSPIYININTKGSDFQAYGGGIHDLRCEVRPYGTHAMLLVGHGKRDGIGYWKIRNSYTIGWGEDGYYLVDKSRRECFENDGWLYGTQDGRAFNLNKIRHNKKHNIDLITDFYWKEDEEKKLASE